jgi:hypothetical protein
LYVPLFESHRLSAGQDLQALVFQKHAMLLERFGYSAPEIVRLPGFGVQTRELAIVDRACRGRHIGVARQQHARDVWPAQAYAVHELSAVHTRHRVVADQHADRLARFLQHAQRIRSAGGGEDL